MEFLQEIDLKIFYLINKGWNHPLLSDFFKLITDIHKNYFFIIAASFFIVFYIWKYKKNGLVFLILLLANLAICDFIAGNIIKPFFARLRPSIALTDIIHHFSQVDGYSFVSNHSANSFCLAFFSWFIYPRSGFFLFPAAFLIGLSRIYLGLHYPSDMIGGMIFGFIISYSTFKLSTNLQFIKKNSNV